MRNSKRTKLLLGAVLGLLVFSFIPQTLAYNVINRSFDDWFYSMDGETPLNDYIGLWATEQLIVWPQFGYDEGFTSIVNSSYHGHILEREMSDGRHMITVQIHVKGAPVMVKKYDPSNFDSLVYFDGEMNYLFQLSFKVNLMKWAWWLEYLKFDDDGFENDTGYIGLPAFAVISLGPYTNGFYSEIFGVEFVSVIFIGTAKGVMVNDWNGLNAGQNAKLKVATLGFANKGYNFTEPNAPTWSLDYLKLH